MSNHNDEINEIARAYDEKIDCYQKQIHSINTYKMYLRADLYKYAESEVLSLTLEVNKLIEQKNKAIALVKNA